MFGNRARNLAATKDEGQALDGRTDYRAETSGLAATITGSTGPITATIHNLSTRGLMASAPQPPKTGESVVVSLGSLPAVNGQVRWVKGSRFGVLLFTALPVGAFRVADQGRGRQPRPPRHIVRIPARIEGPGVDRSATIQNISLSGMALEAGLPVNPGKMLTIHLEGLPPMEGRVRWSRGSRCGVLLAVPLDQDVLDQLTKR